MLFTLLFFFFFFFFSSRRRHTRCLSDWSSDVCSSDLCLGRDEPSLWTALRPDGAGELRARPHPGQDEPRAGAARGDPGASRDRLATSAIDQGPPRRRLLPAQPRPRTVRLREHLRALPEPPFREDLPADPAPPARRRRGASR